MSRQVRERPSSTATPSAPAAPHPRIRARRVAVARDVGRRRRRRLNAVLGVLCAVVWTLVGLRSPLLDVDRIQVSGAERTPVAAVEAALGAGRGAPMVEVDAGAAAERVEALPWVAEARVQRLWPGTVRVVVEERRAVAVVAHPGGWATVDADGRILAVEPEQPAGLVSLAGRRDGAPGAVLDQADRRLLDAVGELPADVRDDVASLATGAGGIVAELVAGPCLVLGDATDLEAKVRAGGAVQEDTGLDGGRIDVRVPAAPALTRDGRCA